MKKMIIYISMISILVFSGCMKDDMRPITDFDAKTKGVFIVCEGNFMYGNASLSYYDIIEKKVENTIFLKANGIPLGDVAQSIIIKDSTAYITVNNSGKIYAINTNTFKYINRFSNLVSPRYIKFLTDSKAYISDMYARSIFVANPKSFNIIDTIDIKKSNNNNLHSSEQIEIIGDKLFTNSWSYDDIVLVIDTNTDKLIDSIKVLPQPRKILTDKENKLWVLCDGGFDGSTIHGNAGILRINPSNLEIEQTFILGKDANPSDMQINHSRDTIYFVNNDIFRFSIYENSLPTSVYIKSEGKNIYAIGLDPKNSDLYVADVIDYMQSGMIYRYKSNKELIDNFTVGIIPNSFVFKD